MNQKLNNQFEKCCLIQSIAESDKHLHPYELSALKRHAGELAKNEKVRLTKLNKHLQDLYRELRIAQIDMNEVKERKLIKQIERVEKEL